MIGCRPRFQAGKQLPCVPEDLRLAQCARSDVGPNSVFPQDRLLRAVIWIGFQTHSSDLFGQRLVGLPRSPEPVSVRFWFQAREMFCRIIGAHTDGCTPQHFHGCKTYETVLDVCVCDCSDCSPKAEQARRCSGQSQDGWNGRPSSCLHVDTQSSVQRPV